MLLISPLVWFGVFLGVGNGRFILDVCDTHPQGM